MKVHDYTGVIHFHSDFSFDGRDSIPEILKAARERDIDFLMLTDHDGLGARNAGFEGWHGETLLIVGQEITPSRCNHYLAFGIHEPITNANDLAPQALIDRVREQGGVGFIAHPDHEGTEMFHVKPFPWIDWRVSGYAGIGIWDFMTDWQSSLNGYVRALLSYCFPALFLKGPKEATLRRWDNLNRESRITGIGELDNHNTRREVFGIPFDIFPFRLAFLSIRTHVLTEHPLAKDARKDIDVLLAALKNGRAYVAQEFFYPAKGFSFTAVCMDEKAGIGGEVELKSPASLKVGLPREGKIRIIKDGHVFNEIVAKTLECPISERGVYRAEAYQKVLGKYRPWIFSNPIYVR